MEVIRSGFTACDEMIRQLGIVSGSSTLFPLTWMNTPETSA
ncbi:MAG: hypothetical protein QM305_06795 [Bacteroidota bacterium]|nr:hypothetical protein [Bacteroidota bacterium]